MLGFIMFHPCTGVKEYMSLRVQGSACGWKVRGLCVGVALVKLGGAPF